MLLLDIHVQRQHRLLYLYVSMGMQHRLPEI